MISVKVNPSSGEDSVRYDKDKDVYIVNVKSPADKNKANRDVLKLLRKHTGKRCKIKSGVTSKNKIVEFID